MAIEPTTITASFFKQIMFLVSLIGAVLFGYNRGMNGLEKIVVKAVSEAVLPLNERITKLEALEKETSSLLAEVSSRSFLNYACLNNFLTSYNRKFNKEFVKPSDIKEKSEDDK